ncbi:MAG: hypothetical protein HY000_26975 [Planctomycetes bacterium]|nr:hypothetical protein [Planctomycetota bacterium]
MRQLGFLWLRGLAWVAGFLLATACLVLIARAVITWDKPCPDYMCFWATGKIIASGRSPYDFSLQEEVQREHGWDKATEGLGFYHFLPYFYPPSVLGVVCVLLVPLGLSTARMVWLVGNAELLFLTGYMLRNAVPGVPPMIPILLVPAFGFSVLAVLVGQLAPLILFLIAAAWRLLANRWDRSAGWVLAWMMIKPQLITLLLVAVLLWSVRQRRWHVMEGLATGLAVLLLASTWQAPSWPVEWLQAIRQTPVVTAKYPWVGATWLLVLRSLGLERWILGLLYLAVAVPFGRVLLRSVLKPSSTVDDVFSLSLLAAFFIAPYARPYDLPVLLIPLLVLIGRRQLDLWAVGLMVVLVVLPYAHFIYWVPPGSTLMPHHIVFFWVPVLLAVFWFTAYMKPIVVAH